MATSPTLAEDQARDDARMAYQSAIALWTYEGELLWAKFNAMLVAHGLILAAISLGCDAHTSMPLFRDVLPIAGLALCVLWWLIHRRSFDYSHFWTLAARQLEQRFFCKEVQLVSTGADFAHGHDTEMMLDGHQRAVHLTVRGRWATTKHISEVVILVFALLYASILVSR